MIGLQEFTKKEVAVDTKDYGFGNLIHDAEIGFFLKGQKLIVLPFVVEMVLDFLFEVNIDRPLVIELLKSSHKLCKVITIL